MTSTKYSRAAPVSRKAPADLATTFSKCSDDVSPFEDRSCSPAWDKEEHFGVPQQRNSTNCARVPPSSGDSEMNGVPPSGFFHRQTSLPGDTCNPADNGNVRLSVNELKGILKRSRCMSETGDSGSEAAQPFDFWYAFRSVEEVFSDSNSSDEVLSRRKRVSFSEKIMQSTFRPGSSIMQQKQKAQKKREKRQSKDRRRTASESDACDLAGLTNNIGALSCSRNHDSDSGLEMETYTSCLEEVAEAEEDEVWHEVTGSSAKKRRNRKNRRGRATANPECPSQSCA